MARHRIDRALFGDEAHEAHHPTDASDVADIGTDAALDDADHVA